MAIDVILHRIVLRRDKPEDTPAVQKKKDMERIGLTAPQSILDEIDKAAKRESASMDKGVVIAIGETAYRDYKIECPIKVGQRVAFAKFGGKDIIDEETGETFVVVNDEDIICKLTK